MSHTIEHSIVIPNKGRDAYLQRCLLSIIESARHCGLADDQWEVIVVGEWLVGRWNDGTPIRFIEADTTPPFLKLREGEPAPFWKNHLLNVGIYAAKGDVITLLDSDMLVGPRFMVT